MPLEAYDLAMLKHKEDSKHPLWAALAFSEVSPISNFLYLSLNEMPHSSGIFEKSEILETRLWLLSIMMCLSFSLISTC
jgi:hypothetical protein